MLPKAPRAGQARGPTLATTSGLEMLWRDESLTDVELVANDGTLVRVRATTSGAAACLPPGFRGRRRALCPAPRCRVQPLALKPLGFFFLCCCCCCCWLGHSPSPTHLPRQAHRVVLAAASPFFRALFAGAGCAMREGQQGGAGSPVRLSGVDGPALRGLLACVYEQRAAVDAESVEALLAASNYLDVPAVTDACCAWLSGGLCPETAAATLAVAARHGCAALQAEAVSRRRAGQPLGQRARAPACGTLSWASFP